MFGDAFVVLWEHFGVEGVVGLADLEGVRQDDAGKRLVFVSFGFARECVVGGFDVDRRDVVGEQHDFVGVQLACVFACQVFRRDEPCLHEACDEGSGADERVDDVHILVGESFAEMFAGYGVGGVQNPVHHLHGGVDDAQRLSLFGEPDFEEAFVEFGDDLLFAFGTVDF
ncbi:Uncharacterised protein [Mycobacteroides abscessus subsp. abscessus]|nr:Uncharacterised protein [Mycobacteroides abscessus subsp. abscessus]